MPTDFAAVRATIEQATKNMTPAEWAFRREGKWTAGQILEHLALTYSGTAKVMEKCLAAGGPQCGRPSLKQRLMALVVADIGYFPPGRKSPKQVEPVSSMEGPVALELILRNVDHLATVYEQCWSQLGTSGFIANHPVLGPLTIRQWAGFHRVHTRHHMKQIAALRTACGQAGRSAGAA